MISLKNVSPTDDINSALITFVVNYMKYSYISLPGDLSGNYLTMYC